ncbi:MAG: bleomycin resistance protein [Planctomycetaceae bacterium]|nr:bleomycin resistance protein [Planctomycetaceae bacterium]
MAHATLTGHAPILLVSDVVAAANHYRDTLGFTYDRFWGDPPGFCILVRDKLHLMLKQAPDDHTIVPHWQVCESLWDVYFWVDDVEALYQEFKDAGAKIDYDLCEQPWGCREFGIQDLDAHDIAFGQSIDDT